MYHLHLHSETFPETTYKTKWCRNVEEYNQRLHHYENLKNLSIYVYHPLYFISATFDQYFKQCPTKRKCEDEFIGVPHVQIKVTFSKHETYVKCRGPDRTHVLMGRESC
ncbi:hypothetical protein L798_14535 [Zootermopsis nevadensis]|uniref:Uncharacterized protein n=1 Tax=Zootermopsis nevadensis TaxID=136037 RepID=A0A067QQJ8_ZOONE|nr:hypothetical protein L798_14535 [Zootermopsis nevadensis]